MPRGRTLNPSPGDIFGCGTFLDESTVRTNGGYLVRNAHMRCSCGNEYSVQLRKLYDGQGRSCRDCRKRLNRINKLQAELDNLIAGHS